MKLKRVISAALAVSMAVSMMPATAVTAFADEPTSSVTASEEDVAKDELLKNDTIYPVEVTKPGTYRMEGSYCGPLDITADGDVTINITGNVTYTGKWRVPGSDGKTNYEWKNYAIRVKNAGHTVTVNANGYSFIINGFEDRGGAVQVDGSGCHAIVNGGFYEAHDDGYGKEIFYNNAGTLELNNVHAEGEILLKSREGTTYVNGGVYKRIAAKKELDGERNKGAIISTVSGTLELEGVEVSAETGSALLVLGGKITVNGGSLTTKDANYSAVYAAAREENDDFDATYDKGGDGFSIGDVTVELNGTTVKDSNNALEVKNGKTVDSKIILKDTTFENNGTDVRLEDGQEFTDAIKVADDNSKALDLKVKDASDESHNVQLAVLKVVGGTVAVDDSVTIEGEKVTINKKGATTTATLPVGASVTVTFNEDAFADSGSSFGYWKITGLDDPNAYQGKKQFSFTMPNRNVTLEAMTKDATIDDDASEALGIAAAVVTGAVGTAVLTYQGYMLGTELYLTYLLPSGAAIPANRTELAMLVWQDAGKPEPAAPVALDAADDVKALTWAVECGLMDETDKNGADLAADASVSRMDVIKTWKKAQEMKNN